MKELEKEDRTYLPEKRFAVIRVDGKGFSKYTRHMDKPFDLGFTRNMQETAKFLAENIDGALFAYTQSDEISVVFSDLGGNNTEWWFGGQIQKLVSISASLATAGFNALETRGGLALFDSRVHHLNGTNDVLAYVQWRQADAIKNSVGMLASHHFSHNSLMGVSTQDRVVRLALEKEVVWSDLLPEWRQGTLVSQVPRERSTTFTRNGKTETVDFIRNEWTVEAAPRFESVDDLGRGLKELVSRYES
jgi:tRNA(His) 5'-end guanylyltransferase